MFKKLPCQIQGSFLKKFQKQLALNSSSIKAQTDGHVPK
jgi:hypothetical protein